jgi:hypothetical protein
VSSGRRGSEKIVTLTVELSPEQAAALCRLTDKTAFSEAMAVLYPHLPRELRVDQAGHIMQACSRVHEALGELHVSAWPWIDTGRA